MSFMSQDFGTEFPLSSIDGVLSERELDETCLLQTAEEFSTGHVF
jgi:hypothetical protein